MLGANIPAIIRGLIAVAWYGIQTYLASAALDVVLLKLCPGSGAVRRRRRSTASPGCRCSAGAASAACGSLQAIVFWRGMEAIRKFIDFCGPAVYVVMFMLAGYLVMEAGWANIDFNLGDGGHADRMGVAAGACSSAIALVVSYFSGPMLNFGDFARYGKSFDAVKKGNFLGLPVNFLVFSLLVVVTAAATPPGVRRTDHRPGADRRPDRQRLRRHAGRADVHDRHHRHQHRGELHLARRSTSPTSARRRSAGGWAA